MSLVSQIVNLNDTFGVLMIGTVVTAVLLGGVYLQAYYYFVTYTDGILLRITVLSLVALETLYIALNVHAVNHYLVVNYFNPFALENSVWYASRWPSCSRTDV
uniref:Uncharacterized protein n=1 Tax=Psilocybe cubensis TaxID=181762 RepID=A0A8H7XMU4_PSICU